MTQATTTTAKVAAVVAGLGMMLAASAFAFVPSSVHAQSASDLQAQISSLLATIQSLQAKLSATQGTTVTTSSCSFTRDLTVGSKGDDVTCLQNALIAKGFAIPAGATGYFGGQSVAAVKAWQKASGISPVAGYFGAKSRAAFGSTTTTTGGGTTGPVVTGNGLKVALSPTSPSGTVLVQGQGIGDLGDYVFSNPSSAPIQVNGVTFNRTGVSNDQTLNNVYLYNGVNRLTDSASVNNSAFSFTNSAGLFTVPAGSTYTVSVRADIATGTSGQQLGVSLVSVSSSGTLDSSVTFPIMSGYQTISAANLATVSFSSTALPATGSISPQSDYPVWQDTVSVSTNPVWLKALKLTNLGSIDASAISNLRLYVDGAQVGSALAQIASDRTISFDLSASPLNLSTQSHIVKVLGNITGGASRTFAFSIQRSSDALLVDSQLGQPVTPQVNSGNFTAVTSGTVTINSVGTTGVSVNKDPASPSQDVSVGATSIKLATFDMLASGENTKVNDLYVYVTTSIHAGGINNGKVFFNGVQVGSTKDIGEGSANVTDFNLGSSLVLPAGTQVTVDVYGDAQTATSTNLSNGETVKVTLRGTSSLSNAQGQSSLTSTNVPGSDVAGNTIMVSSSSLTATKYSGYGNQTMIAGSSNARIGSFTLAAGSTEGVTVNTITLDLAGYAGVTNFTLKDNATGAVIGSAISTPSSAGNSFSVNFAIPQNGTKTIDIYGNILSGASTQIVATLKGTTTTGTGAVTNINTPVSGDVTLQAISVGSGTLSVAVGASNPVASNVIAGAASLEVGAFTFSAVNSPFTVHKLQVQIPNGVASSVSSVMLKYKDASGVTQTATQALSLSATASSTASFTGLNFYVPTNDSSDVSVWVSTPTIANSAVSGAKIVVSLDHDTAFEAADQSGNSTTTPYTWTTDAYSAATTGYGTLVLRKSIPTFANQTVSGTTPAGGQAIYRFTVTSDPQGATEFDQFAFNVSTSTATAASLSLYDVTSGTAVQVGSTQQTNSSNVVKFSLSTTPQQVGAGQTKTYELRPGTVSSWTSGASLTVSLAQDTAYTPNDQASNLLSANNIVWSDRSATSHTTTTGDWTNGYLLKDFVSSVTSFSRS